MNRIPCEKLTVISKTDHCELVTGQDGAVQFSDKIHDFPADLK